MLPIFLRALSGDQVTLTNRLTQNGFAVSGLNATGSLRWKSFIATSVTTNLGDNVTADPVLPNEVIAFGRYQAPAWITPTPQKPDLWTGGFDNVTVTLGSELSVPVQPWIISGPYDQSNEMLSVAAARANLIYGVENTGVWFSFAEAKDRTTSSEIGSLRSAVKTESCDAMRFELSAIGNDIRMLNVYVVDGLGTGNPQSSGGGVIGVFCPNTNIIVLDRKADCCPTVLAHELGHALALWHAPPQM